MCASSQQSLQHCILIFRLDSHLRPVRAYRYRAVPQSPHASRRKAKNTAAQGTDYRSADTRHALPATDPTREAHLDDTLTPSARLSTRTLHLEQTTYTQQATPSLGSALDNHLPDPGAPPRRARGPCYALQKRGTAQK